MTEYAETVAELVPVALRPAGQRCVHAALVMPGTIRDGTVAGLPARTATAPVLAFCRTMLRGVVFVVPSDAVADITAAGEMCPGCATWWPHAAAIERNRREAGR